MKKINLSMLELEMIDGGTREFPVEKKILQQFCNLVYMNTSDIGEKDLARKIYKNPVIELDEDDESRFRSIMENYGKNYFIAIVQEAILKQLDNSSETK